MESSSSCSAPASPTPTPSTSWDPPDPSLLLRLPLTRLRPLIKLDPDVQITAQDAVFMLAKATELFIEHLAAAGAELTLSKKKKVVGRQDIDQLIETQVTSYL